MNRTQTILSADVWYEDAETFTLITSKEKKIKSLWFHTICASALRSAFKVVDTWYGILFQFHGFYQSLSQNSCRHLSQVQIFHLSLVPKCPPWPSVRRSLHPHECPAYSSSKVWKSDSEKVIKITFCNVKLNTSKVIKMNAKVLKTVLSLRTLSNIKLKLNKPAWRFCASVVGSFWWCSPGNSLP